MTSSSALVCSGCGYTPPSDDAYPFRCPRAVLGDDIDHVLVHRLNLAALSESHRASDPEARRDYWSGVFVREEANPFLHYREFLHSWHVALEHGLSEDDWCDIVERLDKATATVEGKGFAETPFESSSALGNAIGWKAPGTIWIKNETGNVSGSHKGRHLMGVMIWLETVRRLGFPADDPARPLAIASCGNAALAAAVVAKAAKRPLVVFIPTDAHPNVVDRLRSLDARLVVCPRVQGLAGDPTYLAFREAVLSGAIPFTCQGNENGLTIDGGKTLAFEIVSAVLRGKAPVPDRVFVQVGGGALASGLIRGFTEALLLGLIPRLPRIHAVQTERAHPLVRAWGLFVDRFGPFTPGESTGRDRSSKERLLEALGWAATHRSEFMWPWETPPHSVAHGILDDETYDWLQVVDGMLESGGCPVTVDEALLLEAASLGKERTGIPVDATGASGLAGAIAQVRRRSVLAGESLVVLFTGRER